MINVMEIVTTKRKRGISNEQKEALSVGRDQGRIVKRYLEAIATSRPKRGRKRTTESIQKQLDVIDQKLREANPLSSLHLHQQKMDLEAELTQLHTGEGLKSLEIEFTKTAAEYGKRKGISYSAWREVGVTADVLKRAGITESRSSKRSLGKG